MPVYNSSRFVGEAIESVLNQTYSDWELIIVDDASTDASPQIIEKFSSNNSNIQVLTMDTNCGVGICRNKALARTKGSYIAYLDSDDLWAKNKLEYQLDFMQANNCAVSFTSYLHIDDAGNMLNKRIKAMPVLSYKKQLRNNYIGNLTGMYNAELLGKIVAPQIQKRQDWAIWLEAIKRSKNPALGINKDLAFYRIRKDSMSANKIGLLKHNYRFYKNYLGYSTQASLILMGLFLWEYFFIRPRYIETVN
tara:strand:- start:768 stop:1517 length:750 start_codon:yes stop_codon:yes gene_type:complete